MKPASNQNEEEKIEIHGPGMGETKKSYSKFVDIDLKNTNFYGLDPDRRGDESFLNRIDIRH